MQYPQYNREPSGCLQTLIISRMILGMLLIPMALIIGTVVAVLLTFYALAVHPLLALLVVCSAVAIVVVVGKWESRRSGRDVPKDE
jgi:hypothetical protein